MIKYDDVWRQAHLGRWDDDSDVLTPMGQLRTTWTAINALLDEFVDLQDSDEITDLQPDKRQKHLASRAGPFLSKLDELRARAKEQLKSRPALTDDMPVGSSDRVLDELRAQEARRMLYAEPDPLKREQMLRAAAEAGDVATLKAAREAPAWKPVLAPDRLAELDVKALQSRDPRRAAEVAAFDHAERILTGAINAVEHEVRSVSGMSLETLSAVPEAAE
ncbi:MAG: hypothetical protein AAF497_06030 [Planctomycetota bacterium]